MTRSHLSLGTACEGKSLSEYVDRVAALPKTSRYSHNSSFSLSLLERSSTAQEVPERAPSQVLHQPLLYRSRKGMGRNVPGLIGAEVHPSGEFRKSLAAVVGLPVRGRFVVFSVINTIRLQMSSSIILRLQKPEALVIQGTAGYFPTQVIDISRLRE